MKWKFCCSLIFFLSILSSKSWADVWCTENITSLIVHDNGNIYLETDQTCISSWCQISLSTPAANNNAYAMLLSAKMAGKKVTFEWGSLSSCAAQNPVYSSPYALSIS